MKRFWGSYKRFIIGVVFLLIGIAFICFTDISAMYGRAFNQNSIYEKIMFFLGVAKIGIFFIASLICFIGKRAR